MYAHAVASHQARPHRLPPYPHPYPYAPEALSHPHPYPPGTPGRPPRLPSATGDMRRYLAIGLDSYLCLLAVGLLVRPYLNAPGAGRTAALLVGLALALSFANQVLLTAAVRASAGKLIMGVRVIALPDAGRPAFRLLVRRWLYGLLWLPFQPWRGLRAHVTGRAPDRPEGARAGTGAGANPGARAGAGAGAGALCTLTDGSPHEDLAGIRQIRRRDLLCYRAAVAARTG
ncbi:RDD family protein [Streptomyces sp. NBC_01237]|uniref:RDD family protein n=1 Tax=Streptomyces sp. NBC_01237 TaxID=2903790 RepID=UPI003FA360CB